MTKDLVILITIGMGAMLLLALAIVLFVVYYQKRIAFINLQKEKELTEAAIRGEEEERTRIASELHDDVGATLASVQLYLQVAADEGTGSSAFTQSLHLIDETIIKVRSLSHRLQPAMLQSMGLTTALHSLFEVFTKSGRIHIEYLSEELPPLGEQTTLGVYRIVQELINNTLKHTAATHAEADTEVVDGILTLRYSHNGDGITEERFQEYIYKKDATGLKNIVNRLKVLNGSICFDKEKHWYHTIISIPL
jgi:two-component system NarL family sensor kinase